MSRIAVSRLEIAVHAAFFLLVIGSFSRLLSLSSWLCVWIVSLSVLLSAGYAVTVWAGERLGRGQLPMIAAVTLMWVLLITTVPATYAAVYSWLVIPLACLLLRSLPVPVALVAIGIMTGLLGLTLFRRSAGFDLFLPPAAALWATVALYARQQRDSAVRQQLIDELEQTRAELSHQQHEAGMLAERARLAREIHDTITQELAGSRMLLQAADREWGSDPARARERVRGVTEMLGQNVVQARRLIADLTPAELEDGGLEVALAELCRREREYGPEVVLTTTGEPRQLSSSVESALLRTAQGALANVRDHAQADRVEVVLDWTGETVSLQIVDNGNGVDDRASAADRGFGLPSLRERLRGLGGTVTLDSTPGRGTALTASVPIGTVTG
ncbi:sensor histidine kinase [Kribbella sp. NPDC056345]|uniref:sensor histidine kinase n=1 Tax=Kribbella sp. NPDC056345 TaxID=3345789 RepID=UPI0035DDCE80